MPALRDYLAQLGADRQARALAARQAEAFSTLLLAALAQGSGAQRLRL